MSLLWLNMRYNLFGVNLTGNLWSLFYYVKMKRGNAVWYNISFHCNVHSLNYISAAINMFKWKRKEAVVLDIIFRLIINTWRKIAVAEASWLMLSSTLLFAELPDLCRSVHRRSHSRVELTKSELPRTQVRNLRTWYREMRADLCHQTICLIFSVL